MSINRWKPERALILNGSSSERFFLCAGGGGSDHIGEDDLRPGFHHGKFFPQSVHSGPFRRHQVGLPNRALVAIGLQNEHQPQMNLTDRSAVVRNYSGQIQRKAVAADIEFLIQLSLQSGPDDIFGAGRVIEVIDVSADPERMFPVQAALGLAVRSAHQQITGFVANHDVRDNLLEARIFLDDRAAAERIIAEDIFQATVEIGGGKGALEQGRNSGSGDNEDVFVH